MDFETFVVETVADFLLKIVAQHKNMSNNKARKYIRQSKVIVNGQVVTDPLFFPSTGDEIKIDKLIVRIY